MKLNILNKRPTCGKRDSGELEMTSQIDCENVCQGEIRVGRTPIRFHSLVLQMIAAFVGNVIRGEDLSDFLHFWAVQWA